MSKRTKWLLALGAALALVLGWQVAAFAGHGLATLPGSNFEIDNNANLKNDDGSPFYDWADLAHTDLTSPEIRATDKTTGRDDDSYQGGVKEDTSCPGETTGSIPNNKSDLLTFHVNKEPANASNPAGYLNLAWSRVSDPSGTTLMDFEFNQSSTNCASGPNKVRTTGDLLIEYAIDQGGARANITGRFWNGSAWGAAQPLSTGTQCGGGPCAVGTINNTSIPAAESDGLGLKQARTFGEAQIDLRLIFQDNKCTTFGTAMLKSRSSDSFTSQLKDFIRPVGINLTNCGTVIIRKQTDPDENPNTTDFDYTKSFGTDPATDPTFTLKDDGVQTFNNVLFGSGYTVAEDAVPAGWEFVNVDCSASTGVTPSVSGQTVTFGIDAATDVLDCTYNNRLRQGAIKVTKTRKHAADGSGDHPHAGVNFTVNGVTKATDANGVACFDGLAWNTYTVHETVPAGYHVDANDKQVTVDNNATCSDNPYGGESVSFHNTPLTDISTSVDSQVNGGTASTITCKDANNNTVASGSTGANGDGSASASNLEPGTYTCTLVVDP